MTARRGPSLFIGLFLAVQLLLPLRYYLGLGPRYDERFAWRMFSEHTLVRCQGSFLVQGRPVETGQEFHRIWVTRFQRGAQGHLVRQMAGFLCRRAGGGPVTLERTCHQPDGAVIPLEAGDTDLCASPTGGPAPPGGGGRLPAATGAP